jgi:hypothetical protein
VADRRLRRLVRSLEGCLPKLSPLARRVLVRRAGLGRHDVASRPEVAREFGLSVRRVGRVERRAARALRRADRSSGCRDGTASSAGAGGVAGMGGGPGGGSSAVAGLTAGSGNGFAGPRQGDGQSGGSGGATGGSGGVAGATAENRPAPHVALPPVGGDGKIFIFVTVAAIILLLAREIQRGTLLRRRVRPYDDRA